MDPPPGRDDPPLGYVIALAAVVFFHLVIGEMVPKNLAMAAPEKAAIWLSPGLVAFARLCKPITIALGACAQAILRLFRVEPKDEIEAVFTSEQLNRLVEDSGQAGLLDPEEQERLEDALELGSRPVTDVILKSESLVTIPRRSRRAESSSSPPAPGTPASRSPRRTAPSWATCT